MAAETTSLFRARVPAARFRNVEAILDRLGLKPGDAFNMLLAQIELQQGLPFKVTTRPPTLISSEQQAVEWEEALGEY
ncbi:MAG: type II toxin-antitoxin system RelB/DinJ family antitoxin [Akkermansiaceae bacterium]|jgi:addiction module RelB/DinJ family antitoxin|nr:type II toxin-antitoxin system RelB/DinJ family antitoxin [Akkermansiaceae bacterium]